MPVNTDSTISKIRMMNIYRKRARFYDVTANLFYLIGFREQYYRKQAVNKLNLEPGGTVVEIGCGTGLNFSLMQDVIGPSGKIIGVDISSEMLQRAQKRIDKHHWQNVELIQMDAVAFEIPDEVDAILMTFAIKGMSDYTKIIEHCAKALASSKRLVMMDLRQPEWCPQWLRNMVIWCLSPFGANRDNADNQPLRKLKRHFRENLCDLYYFDAVYIACGISDAD